MSTHRSLRRTGWLVGLLCILSTGPLASASGVVLDARALDGDFRVRPCTTAENEVSSSPEIAKTFDEQSADNRPPFQWCEAVDIRWLPSATILRFHTAIHVDYAYTYALVRARPEEDFFVMQSGEGLMGGGSSQKLPNAIKALNNLLNSARVPLGKTGSEAACVLFLFLIGNENRNTFFRRPEGEHSIRVTDYRPAERTVAGQRIVRIHARTSVWRFAFSFNGGKLNLASASEEKR